MNADITGVRTGGLSCRTERIERIAALLGEIEEMSHGANDVPLPLTLQTLETLEKARAVLKDYARRTIGAALESGEGDPQPDVDSDMLERMYRTLATGRRPPER
jgi:hypothetical protein